MSDKSRISTRTFLPATVAIVAMAVLRLLPLAMPEARLWGVDAFLYLDPALIVASTMLLLAFALPSVQQRIAEWMQSSDKKKWKNTYRIFIGLLVLSAL